MMRKIGIIGVIALLFAACRPSANVTTPPTAGSANFVNYLAIGSNYTGGFMNGTLMVSSQLNSFPERLFEQFQLIQGPKAARGPFIQPLIHSDNGYPGAKLVLGLRFSACIPNDSALLPVPYAPFIADPIDNQRYVSPANNGQINNLGVLGIRVADYLVAGYAVGANNNNIPYAYRFYNNVLGTPLDELNHAVNNLYPTFFTMELGMNDVLLYALNGGQGNGTGFALPIAPNAYNPEDITPTAFFDSVYDQALNAAIITGASGALINVPDITSLPYFTAIPANGLNLARQGQADTLLAFWSGQTWKKVFQPGANYFIIKDHNGATRQAVPGELILLNTPLDSINCAGWGSTTPIPDSLVLTTDEIQFIRAAVTSYNSFIQFEAQRHNLAYVDLNAYFSQLQAGYAFNGITYNTQFISNSTFSLDGINPTQRGYALIANQVIKTINKFYGSTITLIDANKYHGIDFP
jgi:hypothetical protein